MKILVAVLACFVAGEYTVIAVYVVPRLARIAELNPRILRMVRWGATTFFLGCAVTHATIALQTLDPHLPGGMDMSVRGGDLSLFLEMVLPHIAQILGGAALIYIAFSRLAVKITSKEQAAEQQALDRQFRSAIDRAPLGVALLAEHGQENSSVYVNAAFLDIYGLDAGTSVPSEQDLLDQVHPADRAAVSEAIRTVFATAPVDLEFRVVRRDGAVRWIHFRRNPVAKDGDPTTRVTTIVEDVTDRVTAHAALISSERRFKQLANSVKVGICLRGLDPPQFVWANTAYVEIVGADLTQAPSTPADLLALIHPDDRDRMLAQYWTQAQAGQVAESEHRVLRPDGEVRWVRVTSNPVLDDDGTVTRVAGTVEDITARKETETLRADLLRRVSDTVAASTLGPDQIAQIVVDLAVAVLGDGAVLRVVAPDHLSVESDVSGHRRPAERDRLARKLQQTRRTFAPDSSVRTEVFRRGHVVSSVTAHERLGEFKSDLCAHVGDQVEQFIVAPVRHDGHVVGLLGVYRTDPATPYVTGDEDLLQVLADRFGASLGTHRASQVVEAERMQSRATVQLVQALTAEQHDLYVQLATTEARERALLAEAVHDDPMQLIVSAILRLDLLRGGLGAEDSDELDQVATVLETSVDKLRSLIVALTPPDLSGGLGPALLHLAEGIFVGTTTRVRVTGLTHVHLSSETKSAAYRILREALVNARKHARATTITLDLQELGDQVVLGVTDDGVGAETLDAGRGHLGLSTMRARAEAESAQLEIRSVPGLGTTVQLAVPTVMAGSVAR